MSGKWPGLAVTTATFVVLEHDTGPLGDPAGPGHVHWDFLVALPGAERLATWRLAANPCTTRGEIAAARLVDHRRAYLEYEGAISDGRERVRRIERGPAHVRRLEGEELVIQVDGKALRGLIQIARVRGVGALVFRACADDEGGGG